ncbi:MAG: chitobiase/beta-hexosaminidase C-terminal domain-containing protein [Bacteroidales bacterium]|nr:chitobiase/beta-hexosaminidase C-terminal domain-containing protein [Bacteroidales bacterium]
MMKTNFNPSSTCVSAYMSARNFARNSANNFRRIAVLLVLLLSFAFGARAASYVFYYDGNYMYVNNGAIASTPTFSTACIWEGSNGGKFSNNGYYLVGNNNNNTLSLAKNQNQGTSWTINGNNLYFQNRTESAFIGSTYFYRGVRYNNGAWETVESDGVFWGISNPSFEGNAAVLYQVDLTPYSASTESVITPATSTITLTPSTAELNLGEQEIFTASASNITQVVYNTPEYTAYSFNNITHYYYGGTMHTDKPAGTEQSRRVLSPVFYWDLTGTGASYIASTPNGASNTLKVTSNPSADQTATLSVKAVYGDNVYTTPNASATITVKRKLDNPTGITAEDLILAVDEQKSIRYFLTPSSAYDNIAYSGYDNTIISIDANGIAKGLKAGITTVTLTAKNLNGTNSAHSATSTVTVTPKAPTIEFSLGANITATISTTETGATIYYTTDGTTPTTSSPVYTTPVSVTAGATVKAIVVVMANGTPLTSPVAEALAMAESGIVGNTVFLYDFEDHNWTYYSGVAESVDGGNYNDNYVGKLYSPNPRNVKITYNGVNGISGSATDVRVSISENENSFVYYKTLEQGSTQGEYPYTVISNPFSVRPSTGSDNSKVYYGFAGWKIKSGGEYIKSYNNNDVLPLDANIVFESLPYPSKNCTSAEIVLETTWKQANRTYVSSNPNSNQTYSTNGDYESNFYVINCNYTRNITASSSVTIMMVEPDGSADYTGNSFSGSITPTANGNTKIENAHWRPSSAINPQGRNFTIGRGMTMDGTRQALYGSNSNNSAVNQILKVESGNFSTFTHYGANPSSITKQWITLGCDYDRANNNDNSKLTFTGKFIVGDSRTLGLSSTDEMCRVYSLSGSFMTSRNVNNATADDSYYVGVSSSHNNGHRYLEIQGGEWVSIAGGMGENHTTTEPAFTFRMKGGHIKGSVYGAAQYANAGGTRTYVITGGTINGWVAGGANGTQESNGKMDGASYIYVGGNANVDSEASTSVINKAIGGNIFGAGCGYSTSSNSGQVTLGTNVVVADNAYVERGVYGGGSFGYCTNTETSNIYITGGRVGGVSGGVSGSTYSNDIKGGVFGGACQNQGGAVNIYMTGGEVNGGLYGGSNNSGTIAKDVTMQINGGQVGTSSQPANIHGGGYGQSTRVSGNVEVTLGTEGQATGGVTVYGDVYGGSALGYVNGTVATNTYHTHVTMNKGTIYGSLYGGALGNASTPANVYGPVEVKVRGGSVKATSVAGSGGVYGANNIIGAPQR